MAGRSDDGQPLCKKRMDNNSTRLLSEMQLKARDDLLKVDLDMRNANVLHKGMLGRLKQLSDKLKKTQNARAAEKLQTKIKNTTKEIEKTKNEQDEILMVRRKLEKQTTYYEFCKHLLNIDPDYSALNLEKQTTYFKFCRRLLDSDPENSSLWYFTGAECPVCLKKYKDMAKLNRCQHLLCVDCLTCWFETSHSCPLCQSEIIGYDVFDHSLMRIEYVTATQHHARISKVDVNTSHVLDGPESVSLAVGGTPSIQLRTDLYYIPRILEHM